MRQLNYGRAGRGAGKRAGGRGWMLTGIIAAVMVGVLVWWVYARLMPILSGGTKNPNVIDESEPRMAAATAEAKRRWPEFVELYRNKDFNQKFFVKAKFSEGRAAEWLWVQVNLIDGITGKNGDTVNGMVDTPPQRLGTVLPGSPVSAKLENVGDWLVVRNGEQIGGFTTKVIEEIEKERGLKPAANNSPASAAPPASKPAATTPPTQPATTSPAA